MYGTVSLCMCDCDYVFVCVWVRFEATYDYVLHVELMYSLEMCSSIPQCDTSLSNRVNVPLRSCDPGKRWWRTSLSIRTSAASLVFG